jgi:hypothetical protein
MIGAVPGIDPLGDCGGLGTESAAAGAGAAPDVASRFEPVGALAAAGGDDVAGEAVVGPELVFAVDPDRMSGAPAAGRSGRSTAARATPTRIVP